MLKSVPDRAFHGFAEDEAGAGAGAFAWAVDGSSDLTRDCFDLDTRFSKRGVAHEPTCCRRKLRVPPSMPAAWLVGKRRKTKAARRVSRNRVIYGGIQLLRYHGTGSRYLVGWYHHQRYCVCGIGYTQYITESVDATLVSGTTSTSEKEAKS